MNTNKSFIIFLIVVFLLNLLLGELLIHYYQLTLYTFVDELILILVFPIFYSAYRYSRSHTVSIVVISLGNYYFISYCIKEPEPPSHLDVLVTLILVIGVAEIFRRIGISNRKIKEALAQVQAKNLDLEREIALRKQVEQERSKWQSQLKALFDAAADAIFIKDRDFRYVTLNKSCRNLFGYPESEIVGKTDFDIFPPEFAQAVRDLDRRVLQGEIVRNIDRVSTHGQYFAFHLTKVPLINEEGIIYGLCAIARDITEWKIADAALKESEERFRTIVETMQEGILLTDRNLDVAYANHEAERLFGLTLAETKHRPLLNFVPADVKEMMVEKMQNRKEGISERYSVFLRDFHGSSRWLFFSSTPMRDQDGSFAGILSIVSDITELKKMEQERERLIVDLRNALANIRTLSGLLPICSSCKKIRDDQGYWSQLEEYIHNHSDAEFTHSLCPECIKLLYPQYSLPEE